jgi:hypothetical protein
VLAGNCSERCKNIHTVARADGRAPSSLS